MNKQRITKSVTKEIFEELFDDHTDCTGLTINEYSISFNVGYRFTIHIDPWGNMEFSTNAPLRKSHENILQNKDKQ